jgi:hypothetical protein
MTDARGREVVISDHEELRAVVRSLPKDYAPYGTDQRDAGGDWGSDCSMGCIYFRELDGGAGMDWGVCVNRASHRAGLLTF